MIDIKVLVSNIQEVVGDRILCLYTGRDTSSECAEHLASQLPMRCQWVYWNGRDAHSEPPVYVPVCTSDNSEEDIMEYIERLAQLFGGMTASLVTGDVEMLGIAGTDDMVCIDKDSTEHVALVCICESYEQYL